MFFPLREISRDPRIFRVLLALLAILISGLPARAGEGYGYPAALPPAVLGHFTVEKPWGTLFEPLYPGKYFRAAPPAEDARRYTRGYNWEGPEPENPDWQSLQQDTAYFVAYQFVALAVMYVAPESFSKWDKPDQKDFSLKKWKKNVTNLAWDEDDLYINYILHPYWGATYYILGRERGLSRSHSFWFSFLLSTLFEYGAEALFEPVSIQDLVVTPVAGALVGEYLFSPIRQWIRDGDKLSWPDKVILAMTDPLGVVNAGINRVFGPGRQVRLSSLNVQGIGPPQAIKGGSGMLPPADVRIRPVWGVRLKISW